MQRYDENRLSVAESRSKVCVCSANPPKVEEGAKKVYACGRIRENVGTDGRRRRDVSVSSTPAPPQRRLPKTGNPVLDSSVE